MDSMEADGHDLPNAKLGKLQSVLDTDGANGAKWMVLSVTFGPGYQATLAEHCTWGGGVLSTSVPVSLCETKAGGLKIRLLQLMNSKSLEHFQPWARYPASRLVS